MSNPIDPERIAQAGTEHAHQVALFVWAALQYDEHPELRLMFAIPNGGLRSKVTAANLKAEGVKASVPDVFLPVASGGWHGLFIEMKKPANGKIPAGRADDGQMTFIHKLQMQGYGACVCVGWKEAAKVILQYLEYGRK